MPAQFYVRKPGLTQQQVENVQKRLQRAAEEKEKRAEVDAPGDVNIDPTMTLSLSGTQSAFDQSYEIESIVHNFSAEGGYRMTVTAKNSGQGASGYSSGSSGTQSFQAPAGFTIQDIQNAVQGGGTT